MSNTVRKRLLMVMGAVGCLLVAGLIGGGGALAARGSKGEVVCEKTGKRKVSCPKKELRGKHGKRGAGGPAGPAGPMGPAGPPGANGAGIPLIFRGQLPTSNTRILDVSGLLINASCNAGAPPASEPVTSLTGVSGVPGSIVRATDVVSGAIFKTNSSFVNQQFVLTPGVAESNYVMTYLAGNGSSIVTANYGIANGGMSLLNVSCAVFGTAHVAIG